MAAAEDFSSQSTGFRTWFLCAWCRSPLIDDGLRPEDCVENFGICPTCLRDQLAKHLRTRARHARTKNRRAG